jgi:hypothetical protein
LGRGIRVPSSSYDYTHSFLRLMMRRLLRSGYSAKEINAAAKSATTIRQERAETLRELRIMMQSLTLESHNTSRDTPMTASASPTEHTSLSAVSVCPSPVITSPIRPSLRGQSISGWRDREPQRRRRTRLPKSTSPMPLKIRAQPIVGNTNRQSLSPLRTKSKLSTKYTTSARTEIIFDEQSPSNSHYPPQSPSLKSNMKEECGVIFCASPSMTPNRYRQHKKSDEEENLKRIVIISPVKKLTPIKRTARFDRESFDRPLIMPNRWRTPSPSPRRATRVS